MPVSRRRKKKPGRRPTASRSRAAVRPGYVPSSLPDDPEVTFEFLVQLPPELLHTVGLAIWYLGIVPNRRSNQCLAACQTLELALRVLGVDARTLAATVDLPWGANGGVRYGSEQPHADGSELVGHTVLLADGCVIDPTALQFPELRAELGARPLFGRLSASLDDISMVGASAYVKLGSGRVVRYGLLPEAVIAPITRAFGRREGSAIQATAQNLVVTYGAVLSQLSPPALERLSSVCPPLAAQAMAAKGKSVRWVGGLAELVDEPTTPESGM